MQLATRRQTARAREAKKLTRPVPQKTPLNPKDKLRAKPVHQARASKKQATRQRVAGQRMLLLRKKSALRGQGVGAVGLIGLKVLMGLVTAQRHQPGRARLLLQAMMTNGAKHQSSSQPQSHLRSRLQGPPHPHSRGAQWLAMHPAAPTMMRAR